MKAPTCPMNKEHMVFLIDTYEGIYDVQSEGYCTLKIYVCSEDCFRLAVFTEK